MKKSLGEAAWVRCAIAAALIFFLAGVAGAGQNKKKKKQQADDSNQAQPIPMPTPDSDQIEQAIGGMLAAFQLGDADTMHKYYSDNATFVRSGEYAPPIVGWQNYAADFKAQWAAFQSIQLIRKNTLIYTHNDFAWATYQWEFLARFNGKAYSARGQTTLVFNKLNGNWLIMHNHTSEICAANAPAQSPAVQPPTPQPNVPQPGSPRPTP
jgi:ketosteroid isomerase-like protein